MRILVPILLCAAFCHAQEAAPTAPPPPAQPPATTPAPPAEAPKPAVTAGGFKVVMDPAAASPFTGRVFIALIKDLAREPRQSMSNWFVKTQVLAVDVKDLKPGDPVSFDASAIAYPKPLSELEPGDYAVQAIAHAGAGVANPGLVPGDLFSEPIPITFKPGDAGTADLKLTKTVEDKPFRETDRVKEVAFVSPLLSKFYGHDVTVRAAVILPRNWRDDPAAHHPTVYIVPGFGHTHQFAHRLVDQKGLPASADDVMVVVPDPSGPLGHTGFADSENNGPRGQSLVQEIVPAVELKFHGAAAPHIRWATGIATGGWSSLWLATNYPDTFGMAWSFCPDPVDFRDFQKINLYDAAANVYKDESGSRRPLIHNGKEVVVYFDDYARQAAALGRGGGQVDTFEGICSPKGDDGKPRPIFDRKTGAVDAEVAKAWEKYDIRMHIERNWEKLKPRVDGHLHVYAAEFDNFYLDGSARLLDKAVKGLNSSIDVHIVPNMGHDIPKVPWKVLFQILRDRAAGGSNLPSIDQK